MCLFEAQRASHLQVLGRRNTKLYLVRVCLPRQVHKNDGIPLSESVQPRIKINVF